MKISVLMSIYAKESPLYLRQVLQSLTEQSMMAEEVVLVEDGPIGKDLKTIIEQYRNALNIKSVRLGENRGLGFALNEGLKHCGYDLVARMDTDDICFSQRFEKQLAAFHNDPCLDLVGSFVIEIDRYANPGNIRTMPITHELIMDSLWTCPFIHPTVIFRREKLLQAGGYDQNLRRRQDYELWFRCAMHGFKFANIPEILMLYRFDRDTHKKQPVKLALEQALVGYKGAVKLNMAMWKRFACFVPFFRALLPADLQHAVYTIMSRFDPRKKHRDELQ